MEDQYFVAIDCEQQLQAAGFECSGLATTREEALEKWGHERVLADAVRVVRMVRPLVVTSVFVGGRTDGHGNHQVAGQMAQEAYKAAGDPSMFPEQIKEGLRPWKVQKDYAMVPFSPVTDKGIFDYADGKFYPAEFHNYTDDTVIKGALTHSVEVPEGEYDPMLGYTYLQVSRLGLGHQKSQNGGTGLPPAEAAVHPSEENDTHELYLLCDDLKAEIESF